MVNLSSELCWSESKCLFKKKGYPYTVAFTQLYLFFLVHARYRCRFWVSCLLPPRKNIDCRGGLCLKSVSVCVFEHTQPSASDRRSPPAHLANLPFVLRPMTREPYHGKTSVSGDIGGTFFHRGRIFNMMNARYSLNGYYLFHGFAFFGHYSFHVILLTAFRSIPP